LKFLVILLFFLTVLPVFAEPLSDRTGLSTSFDVRVDGKTFEIKTTANFDIRNVRFEQESMFLDITSSLENNIGELQIPKNVTSGQIKFYLDGAEIPTKVLQNEKISFVTLEFKGNGTHTLEMKSAYVSPNDQLSSTSDVPKNNDQTLTIVAVVVIMIAVGMGSTFAYYYKTKSKPS